MQGSIPAYPGERGKKKAQLNSRVVSGVTAMIVAIAAVSIYTFWRVDRVQENVQAMNQFYVPVLKHLNLIGGKWQAYQRAFEQAVGFRKWGTKGAQPEDVPKLRLKKMIDGNLDELARIESSPASSRNLPERESLRLLTERLRAVADHEAETIAEIESLVKLKRYAEAAGKYAKARQENVAISQDLTMLSRDVEAEIGFLQLATEQELRSSQSVMLVLLGASLLFSIIVLFRLQRWLKPVGEWTRVAQEIALKGLSRDIRFPQIRREMPPEISLLTREFTRMGMTVLERERTIRAQRDKVETLNEHLKEQNEMLRKLGGLNERILNSMSSGLLVINSRGVVEQFNNRYCELFGIDRAKLMGWRASEVLAHWPEPLVADWLGRELVTEDSTIQQRNHLAERVFDVRVQPLHAQGGRLLLFEDVTEVVEAEKRLEHAKKLVLAGNLSSQVAHEVRNPLNSMSLQLEMLEEDLEAVMAGRPDDQRSAIARIGVINEQVQRLDRITRRYLDMGRTQGTVTDGSKRQPVHMHELVERCLSFLSGEIQAARAGVQLEFKARAFRVAGEADALSQVIFNLVRNGLDAIREAGPASRRTLILRSQSDESWFRLSIADTGKGIEPAIRGRIFEPFVTHKPDGHGLGLSVSRQVCIEHGGELRLKEPMAGTGAVFEIVIPLLQERRLEQGGGHAPHPDR